MAPNYRPHVDGLRAVAVLGVIVFHLKLLTQEASAVPGGFTGVDVFFVISGFLISKIVISECQTGSFSFVDFYARRAHRIMPALCVMLCLTLLAGYFLFHPIEYERLSASLLAAVVFCANIFFYAKSDYFAPAASELPLLHLWSLGVEEQFYLLLPVVIVALRRSKKSVAMAACLAALLCSLAASQAMTAIDPPAAFYLLPFRAFELLIGTVVATGSLPHSRSAASIGSMTGLVMIAGSYLFLSRNRCAFREWQRYPRV